MLKMSNMVCSLYHKAPPSLQCVAYPFELCFRTLKQLKLDFWIVNGLELSTKKPLSVLCAAYDKETKNYLSELIFGESYEECYFRSDWVWNIPSLIDEVRSFCSLMIVELHKQHRKLVNINNCFFIPCWVRGEVHIPFSTAVMESDDVRWDLRRIKKNSLQFEITRDPQRFDDFYYNMYVPYITKAHGRSAYVNSYELMRKNFQDSDLLLIKKKDKYIAGRLIWYEKEGPHLYNIGLLDGNMEYRKYGAVNALYYFSFQYLEEKGFTKVNMGNSRAFLRDGVLRLKGKWSQEIADTSSVGFELKVLSDTAASRAFLLNNPFIFESQDHLQGAVFVDSEKPLSSEEINKIDKKYFHPGLSRLHIYNLHSSETIEKDSYQAASSQADISKPISFRSFEELL